MLTHLAPQPFGRARSPRRTLMRRHAAWWSVPLTAALFITACTTAKPAPNEGTTSAPAQTPPPPVEAPVTLELGAYGVSSGHALASRAGMLMLERGGTAVDAAIAAAFADAVMQPASSGIGGGGVSIVVSAGTATNYDYREVVNEAGIVPPSGTGVPGFVAGMERLHRDHGTLAWAELLEPAIEIAEAGGPVSRYLANTLNGERGRQVTAGLAHFRRPDGSPLQAGDALVQTELAETMRVIAEEGPSALYTGSLVALLTQVEGIDAASLAAYELQVSQPARGRVGDFTMLSGTPALPGAAIIQMIQIAEAAGIGAIDPESAQFVDLQSRAWQVADHSVQTWFGDPDFVDVPVERLTDPALNAEIANALPTAAEAARASAATAAYGGAPNTTHISVVDSTGMAVSMTNTITNYWGSGQYFGGFFMNDQLERFDDIGAEANVPQPGRRSVTWSSPSMLLDEHDRPVLVVGTPGGRQIPNTTATVVTRWALHGQGLEQAITAERFHLTGGELRLESDRLRAELAALGYTVRVTGPAARPNYGSVQALEIDWEAGTVSGVADHRRSAGVETAVGDPRRD